MDDKKFYSTPTLYSIDLHHEQAILSAYSLLAANPMAGGADITCRSGGCKKDKTGGTSDCAKRPS